MEFRVLGPLDVRSDTGRPVTLGARKHRTLLAALLLSANHAVAAARLVDALWSRRPPRSAPSVLRTYVSALRKALGHDPAGETRLEGAGGGYRLRVAPGELDLLVFEELAAAGRRALAGGDLPAAVASLRPALALWRGRPLEDVPLDGDYGSELARLEDARLGAVEALAEARLGLGGHTEALAELAPYVAAQPVREPLHAHWMLALYRAGRQADALAAYRELRARLVERLGLEPGPGLQGLHRRILTADPALDSGAGVPAVSDQAAPGEARSADPGVVSTAGSGAVGRSARNGAETAAAAVPLPGGGPAARPAPRQVPPAVATFTGRAGPLARLRRLLTEPGPAAVCAIDGIGGIGKSALAVQVANQVADRFADGLLYADLHGTGAGAPPTAPLAVLNRFLRDLGARYHDAASLDEAAAGFRAATADRSLLVVLDNARDAAQVHPLLPAGPRCRVLVTSRQVLSTLDNVVHLHLDLLDPAEAMALLRRLAGTERIAADPTAAEDLARLCDHLPLALRIAGARLAARPAWPIRALADRLDDAGRRLDELEAGDLGVRACFGVTLRGLRDSPDRYDRAAAAAFPLLSLPDGTDLSGPLAARLLDQPTRDAELALERLVDARLVDTPAPGRYRLHDLLRLLGRETAATRCAPAEQTAALVRALSWYAEAAVAASRLLRPGDPHPALTGSPPGRSGAERVQFTLPGAEPDQPGPPGRSGVERLPFALPDAEPDQPGPPLDGPRFTDARNALDRLEAEHGNIVALVAQCAARPGIPATAVPALAQTLYAYFLSRGHWHDWTAVSSAALDVAKRSGDRRAQAYAERDLGVAHERLGEYPRAEAYLTSALEAFHGLGERHGAAACLTSLGIVHHRHGRYADAVDCHRESIALRRTIGDLHGQASALNNLASAYQRQGDLAAARDRLAEGLVIAGGLGDRRAEAGLLTNLGVVAQRQGCYTEALEHQRRALAAFRDLDDRDGQAACLNNLGTVHRMLGEPDAAIDCHREGLALSRQLGDGLNEAECLRELGTAQHAAGRHAQARASWRRAREIYESVGAPQADDVAALLSGGRPIIR